MKYHEIKHGKAVPVPDTPSSDSLIEDLTLDHRGKQTEPNINHVTIAAFCIFTI